MTDRQAPSPLHGVSFTAYATVLAGLDDGFPLARMLAFTGVSEASWERAQAAFADRILDDLEAGGTLDEALYAAKAQAQRGWLRRIPPLDTDLEAWLSFSRAFAEAEDPDALLEELGLRTSDVTRLETLWGGRLSADPALKIQAVRILSEPPRPFPKPSPTGPDLPPRAPSNALPPGRTP